MSKYFEKFKNPILEYREYREYLEEIMRELGRYGYFKGSIETLNQLWRIFSEECYCAGFMTPDDETISEFADWLDNYEEDI